MGLSVGNYRKRSDLVDVIRAGGIPYYMAASSNHKLQFRELNIVENSTKYGQNSKIFKNIQKLLKFKKYAKLFGTPLHGHLFHTLIFEFFSQPFCAIAC